MNRKVKAIKTELKINMKESHVLFNSSRATREVIKVKRIIITNGIYLSWLVKIDYNHLEELKTKTNPSRFVCF